MRLFSPTSSKRLNEVMGFLFLCVGLLLLQSLISYHAQDASWNTAAGRTRPLNLIGPVGAHVADLFLQTFGAGAFLFPFLIFALGWKWIRSEEVNTPLIRLAGFMLFLAGFGAAISLFRPIRIFDGLIPAGGIAGQLCAEKLREGFNLAGACVVSLTAMIVSVYLFSAFTLEKLHGWLKPIAASFRNSRTAFKEWRERRRERAVARRASRALARQEVQAAKSAGRHCRNCLCV